jgi:hypothetical protein
MVKDYTAIGYSKYCMLEVPNRKKKRFGKLKIGPRVFQK